MNTITASSAPTVGLGHTTINFCGEFREMPKPTRELFEVVVNHMNQLELRPLTDLAKSLATMWLTQTPRMMVTRRGKDWKYGHGVESFTVTFEGKPLLASGDDPFFTGMNLTVEEHEIARKAVERERKRKQREALPRRRDRKSRKRTPEGR